MAETGEKTDFLLTSIVESGFIINSLKTVLERQKHDAFVKNIDNFVETQTKQIQWLCSEYYEEFLKSTAEIKHMRGESSTLKDKINDVTDDINSAGRIALEKGKELLKSRATAENMTQAIAMLYQCKNASALMTKVHKLLSQKKWYSALVAIEQLETELHKKTLQEHSFVKFLQKQVPEHKVYIRYSVSNEFNNWLSSCKRVNMEIGKMLIHITEKQMLARQQNKMSQDFLQEFDNSSISPMVKYEEGML